LQRFFKGLKWTSSFDLLDIEFFRSPLIFKDLITMKFNFFCLVLFALAAIIGCDNRVEDVYPNDVKDSTGKPTYIALDLSENSNTYAGETSLKGFADERNIGNAAVFIYKWDGANTTPECYAFVTAATSPILLKLTDGTKKVFVAANIGPAGATFFGAFLPASPTPMDEGDIISVPFSNLNPVIWSSGTASPGWTISAPTSGSEEGSANGLIKALAGGTSTFSEGLLALTPTQSTSPNRYYLLSNWDNTVADSVSDNSSGYLSTCLFTFVPDIPKSAAPSHPNNGVTINVQLAVAKATMKFDPAILYSDGFSYLTYGSGGDKGFFTPWNASISNPGIFTAGNINKETTVFQKFQSGSIADDNYGFIESIPSLSNDDWYKNFDNTRVFGTGKLYLTSGNTVTNIYTAMTGAQAGEPNSVRLGMDTLYLTENAQSYTAGFIDNSTYLIVGGKFNPKNWISSIQQASIPSNPPIIAFNDFPIPPGTPSGAIFLGTDYAPVTYSSSPASNDTLYFHRTFQLFFLGKENLCKYYAWVQNYDRFNPTPETSATVLNAIQSDLDSRNLISYYQGNCFYRVFIVDYNADRSNERVLVRRNHSYNIIISKILGPGIDDAYFQKSLMSVMPVDSYSAFSFSVMDQHQITQIVEVSNY